jgi:hypothetical protein
MKAYRMVTGIEKKKSLSSMDFVNGEHRLTAFTPEIDCDLTAMGLPSRLQYVLYLIHFGNKA